MDPPTPYITFSNMLVNADRSLAWTEADGVDG